MPDDNKPAQPPAKPIETKPDDPAIFAEMREHCAAIVNGFDKLPPEERYRWAAVRDQAKKHVA